jgi:chromate reductase
VKLLGISGSLRKGSFNTMLLRQALSLAEGAETAVADLNLPLYDGDVEAEGIPAPVQTLIDRIRWADAVVFASPEYNKGVSGVLKNALDWQSRVKPVPLAGKPVLLMGAAAGRAGGEVGHYMLRHCLAPFGVRYVSGPPVLVGAAHDAFEDGKLKDEGARKLLADTIAGLAKALGKAG